MYTLCTLLLYELVCRMLYMSNTLTLSVKEGQASKLRFPISPLLTFVSSNEVQISPTDYLHESHAQRLTYSLELFLVCKI